LSLLCGLDGRRCRGRVGVDAVANARGSRENGRRGGHVESRGAKSSASAIYRRPSCAVGAAALRGGIDEGRVLKLAGPVADNLPLSVGLLLGGRNRLSGGICDGEAGGPENIGRVGRGELVEIDLAVGIDRETGICEGVVRSAGAIDGGNSCG
jgi:hypothetical protein